MRFFARLSLSLIVALVLSLRADAQTPASPAGTGTISGRVMNIDKPLAGIVLSLRSTMMSNSPGSQSIARAVTDADGSYEFTGIAGGSYTIVPVTPLYVLHGINESGISVSLNDGETLTRIDLTLVRGGVITGKVTDSDGRPVIEQYVRLDLLDKGNDPIPMRQLYTRPDSLTDDRGVYRLYGIPPGRYRVRCGDAVDSVRRLTGRKSYPRTYHPDVSDATQAKLVAVTAGGEATGIDIRIGSPTKTYSVIGRVVDAGTGEGVEGVSISYIMHRNDGRPGIVGRGEPTGANGEFRLVSMRTGRFSISAGGSELTDALAGGTGIGPGSILYSNPVSIEIIEADVIGIELKVRRGGSVSGFVVIEENNDVAVQAQLSRIRLIGLIHTTDGSPQTPLVTQTGIGLGNLFRFDGIRPCKFHISAQIHRLSRGKLTLARIERNGALQPDGIDVGPGEQVGGVRLVFVFGN